MGDAASVAGKFWELFQGADSQWYFHVKAGNGQILLTSVRHTSRVGAPHRPALGRDERRRPAREYTLVQSAHGYSVDLLAANHEIFGTTEVYMASKSNATRAIGTVSEDSIELPRRPRGAPRARASTSRRASRASSTSTSSRRTARSS